MSRKRMNQARVWNGVEVSGSASGVGPGKRKSRSRGVGHSDGSGFMQNWAKPARCIGEGEGRGR